MDPLNIHHVLRHPLSRIKTNDFQDKSGCSINGFRSFLFDEGMVRDLDDIEWAKDHPSTIRDYRGYPIQLQLKGSKNYPYSDEILRMKNVRFLFLFQLKPNHKLVSPEPHFVEEEKNLIENHFSYLGSSYKNDDIEEWECFQMDYEGHLVSLISHFKSNFQFSNESIEHLSNFPHLRIFSCFIKSQEEDGILTNLSLLSDLRELSISFQGEFSDPELLKDLGLFSNLVSLSLEQRNLHGSVSNPYFYVFSIHRMFCDTF